MLEKNYILIFSQPTTITCWWNRYACWALYKYWNLGIRLDVIIFISCFTLTFVWHLLLITGIDENQASLRCDIIKRNATQSNFEIVNYLELVVCVVSDHYQLLFPLKIKNILQKACEITVALWHTLANTVRELWEQSRVNYLSYDSSSLNYLWHWAGHVRILHYSFLAIMEDVGIFSFLVVSSCFQCLWLNAFLFHHTAKEAWKEFTTLNSK